MNNSLISPTTWTHPNRRKVRAYVFHFGCLLSHTSNIVIRPVRKSSFSSFTSVTSFSFVSLSHLSLVLFAFLGQVTHVESTWRPKLNTFRALTTISRARLCKRSISVYMDGRHEEKKINKMLNIFYFFSPPIEISVCVARLMELSIIHVSCYGWCCVFVSFPSAANSIFRLGQLRDPFKWVCNNEQ